MEGCVSRPGVGRFNQAHGKYLHMSEMRLGSHSASLRLHRRICNETATWEGMILTELEGEPGFSVR